MGFLSAFLPKNQNFFISYFYNIIIAPFPYFVKRDFYGTTLRFPPKKYKFFSIRPLPTENGLDRTDALVFVVSQRINRQVPVLLIQLVLCFP